MRPALPLAVLIAVLLFTGCDDGARSVRPAPVSSGPAVPSDWPSYGGDAGGSRHADLRQIHHANVQNLEVAWTHRHGDVAERDAPSSSAFQATPILLDDTLFYCTPFGRVFALDPATGEERWVFDPQVPRSERWSNQLTCRGVAAWRDPQATAGSACATRILQASLDARLIALDAASGRPCAGFGEGGEVNLLDGVGEPRWTGEYSVTSPPAIAGDLAIVGSAISDNQRVDAPSGVVRAYDVRSGALRWAFDPAPPGAGPPPAGRRYHPGTPNVWSVMSVDAERDLVFLPTGNPAPDYWRGARGNGDHYGSSVVALRASTGEPVWHFQTVHHDLWDFDVPAQPTLVEVESGGDRIPALVQPTKMGFVFVLHRETGEPLLPVEERPVPRGGAAGETLSPTQPFPVRPPPLVRTQLAPDDAWGLLYFDRRACRQELEALRNEGIYTPPSEQGSLMYPGNAGGANWGGAAVDPARGLAFVNVIDLPWVVRLVPRHELDAARAAHPDREHAPGEGTPYGIERHALLSPLGLPCNPPPWGTLAAIDLASGELRWQVPLGTVRDLAPVPLPLRLGTPSLGGPLSTASGLVFIGAALDDYLRAFDAVTGEELWKGRLPAGGQATPMSYVARDGRQYVVIAAGGHGRAGTRLGDYLVAFALPAE